MFFTLKTHQSKPAFSNSSGLKTVFKKLSFRDGLVWTIGLTVEIKLRFSNFSSVMWTWGLSSRLPSTSSSISSWLGIVIISWKMIMSFSFFSCSLTFFSFLLPSLSCKNVMRHVTRGNTSDDYMQMIQGRGEGRYLVAN